jgi:hypothetical protein
VRPILCTLLAVGLWGADDDSKDKLPGDARSARLDFENAVDLLHLDRGHLAVEHHAPASTDPKGTPHSTGVGERGK